MDNRRLKVSSVNLKVKKKKMVQFEASAEVLSLYVNFHSSFNREEDMWARVDR